MKFRPNFSWPATLSFSADNGNENERFSRGKLKVFFKGETVDHRLFSDNFSEEVIKSLPYTPIVSYYDEEKQDFVGHATEQAIYGIVDPCGEITFEKGEDGNTWAVCDTVYYTERPGKVGEIASKIEGHSQSLELDPKTVKYVINYDKKRHFKNLEFTAGHFIGVSVLGKDQKPAFTGSEFFSVDAFAEKMNLLKEYCEARKNEQASGGNEMNLTEFIKLSWGEKAQKVADAVDSEYGREYYNYVVDMYEDRAIMRFYSYFDGSSRLMSISYSLSEEGVVTLGDIKEVHVTYEEVPEVQAPTNATEEQGVGQGPSSMSTDSAEQQKPTEPENNELSNTVNASTDPEPVINQAENTLDVTTATIESTVTETTNASVGPVADNVAAEGSDTADTAALDSDAHDTQMKVGAVDEQIQKEGSGSAALTESERAEFEALKRKEKEDLIKSYKDFLSEEQYNGYFATIDSVSKEELELNLLKDYKSFTENNKAKKERRVFSFSPITNSNGTARSSLAQDIQYYLGK